MSALRNPKDETVWSKGHADPLDPRWHAPGLIIAAGMIALTATVSVTRNVPIRDMDGMISGRMGLLIGVVLFFLAVDVVPRAIRRPGARQANARTIHRERWPRRRLYAVGLGLLSFYATYFSYRNLKSFLPALRVQDLDPGLFHLDRTLLFGHDPGPLLHSLLGTGLAPHVLSSAYLFFLAFIPISLGAALIASANPIPGMWYVTTLGMNWVMGIVTYYAVPAMGPLFLEPHLYAGLPATGVSALQQSLLTESSAGVNSIAAFASLHVSVVFSAVIMAHLLKLAKPLRLLLWGYLTLTVLATVYFGWHYLVDDAAGFVMAPVAVVLAGLATGHVRPRVAPRWRVRLPNAITLARIALIPLVVVLLTRMTFAEHSAVAAALFAVVSASDFLDGLLARRWKVVSVFGTLADPLADKLLVIGSLGALVAIDRLHLWVVVVVAARELVVSLIRARAKRQGLVIPASPLGKGKMVLQSMTVVALILGSAGATWLDVLVYAMVIVTVASGVEHWWKARAAVPAGVAATSRA